MGRRAVASTDYLTTGRYEGINIVPHGIARASRNIA